MSNVILRPRKLVIPRRFYWWGHDTDQDKEKRIKDLEDKRLIKWMDPAKTISGRKSGFGRTGDTLVPQRIKDEAETLGMSQETKPYMEFRWSEWLNWVAQPVLPSVFDGDSKYYHWKLIMKMYNELIRSQIFVRERFVTLGPDLAAAQFLCWRNCRVRFKGHSHWTELDSLGELPIPDIYEPGWYIEAIDAAHSELIYEGLQNCRNLIFLRYLDLSYCPHIDVWCLDRLTGEYGDTLEYLDISGCPSINWNAIEILWRLRKLKTLVMYDLTHIRDLPLLCIMLLDLNPDLEIKGVDYIDTKLLEGTEHEHLLKELDNLSLLPESSKIESKSQQ